MNTELGCLVIFSALSECISEVYTTAQGYSPEWLLVNRDIDEKMWKLVCFLLLLVYEGKNEKQIFHVSVVYSFLVRGGGVFDIRNHSQRYFYLR